MQDNDNNSDINKSENPINDSQTIEPNIADNKDNLKKPSEIDVNNLNQVSSISKNIIDPDNNLSDSTNTETTYQDVNVQAQPEQSNIKDKDILESSLPVKSVKDTKPDKLQKNHIWQLKTKKHKIIFIALMLFLIIAFSVIGGLFWRSTANINKRQQANIIDSNISIGGINVSNLDSKSASESLQNAIKQQIITLAINEQNIQASPNDLGITYKTEETVQKAIKQRRPILSEIGIIKKEQINITPNVNINNQQLADYINSKVGAQLLSKNAEVVIENNQLIVKPSAQGSAIDINDLTNQVSALQLSQKEVAITAKTSITEPSITTEVANKAKSELDTYIAPAYSIGNPSVGYKDIPMATKLSWLVISPNLEQKTIDTSIDANKVNLSLDTIIKSFNINPQERIIVILPGGQNIVSQDGYDGVSVPNDSLNASKLSLSANIAQKQSAKVELATQPIARSQRTLDGFDKMVLVNKGAYKTQAIQNGAVQKEVTVSTGKPGFETPNGTYSILRKKDISDMKGCGGGECWEVKNVKWQSYFTNEGHAIHGTWWYVNYGKQNASHGCVNMKEADAEWFYNWLDIGTPVVVI